MDAHIRSAAWPLVAGKHCACAVGPIELVTRTRLASSWILRSLDHLRRGVTTNRFTGSGPISRLAQETERNRAVIVSWSGRFVVCARPNSHPRIVDWVYRFGGLASTTQRYAADDSACRALCYTTSSG